MRCGPIRFRVVLPIVFGFLAAMLMVWNHENDRKVALMGMGWDMRPPFWPYQAIYLLLIHDQRSRICSFNANPQAAEPSDTFLAVLRLVSGDCVLVAVDRHSLRLRRSRSSALSQASGLAIRLSAIDRNVTSGP
jgi:hypothetical protein